MRIVIDNYFRIFAKVLTFKIGNANIRNVRTFHKVLYESIKILRRY